MLDATPNLPSLADLPPLHRAAFGFLAEHTPTTRAAYEAHLKRFFEWCGANGLDPLTIERTHVSLYVRYLAEERGNRPTTINSVFTAIKGFYKWAFLEDIISRDPVVHVRLPKGQYRKKYPLEREELRAIRYAGYEIGGRHWALTEMLVVHGMRISECCDVLIENFQHVEGGHRVLTFRRKGGKEETVPLPPQMVAAFEECAGDRTEGYLIHALDYSPGKLHRSSATGLLNTVVRRSGAHPQRPPIGRERPTAA